MEFMPNPPAIISQTQTWLSTVIIAHKLCPFAEREFDSGRIHYAVIETDRFEAQLETVIKHCGDLDEDKDRETTLLIFPNGVSEFEAYLDLLEQAGALMKDQGYEGVYQLASFHPDYRFNGASEDDPSNYTNRSPYPILHILREASVERALESYPNPEDIPARNIELTRDIGLTAMKAMLKRCYE